MKWEQRLAALVVCLLLVLAVRGFLLSTEDTKGLPSMGEESFYHVYFAAPDGESLVPEFRAGKASISGLLEDLVGGPRQAGLVPVLPPQTEVLGYTISGRVLFVNFSQHLVSNHPKGSRAEILTVYGIVNTLVGTENIEWVQILVENERLPTLAGHISIREPLHKDYTILRASII